MDIITLISIAAAGQLILVVSKFLTEKFTRTKFLLLAFILVLGLDLVHDVMVHSAMMAKWPFLYATGTIYIFLLGPLLLFYILSITRPDFKFKPYFLLLLIPAVLEVVRKYPSISKSRIEKITDLNLFYAQRFESSEASNFINWDILPHFLLNHLQLIVYFLIIIFLLRKKKKELYGLKELRVWLYALISGLMFFYIILSALEFLPRELGPTIAKFSLFVFSLYLFVLSFLLSKYEIAKASIKPISKDSLTKENYEELFKMLDNYLVSNELFLNLELKIDDLGLAINKDKREISKCIKILNGTSFPDFINKYRIERAKKLLVEKEHDNYTIAAIGELSGFKSKDAFYRAFQKNTGKTPGSFRKDELKNQN